MVGASTFICMWGMLWLMQALLFYINISKLFGSVSGLGVTLLLHLPWCCNIKYNERHLSSDLFLYTFYSESWARDTKQRNRHRSMAGKQGYQICNGSMVRRLSCKSIQKTSCSTAVQEAPELFKSGHGRNKGNVRVKKTRNSKSQSARRQKR